MFVCERHIEGNVQYSTQRPFKLKERDDNLEILLVACVTRDRDTGEKIIV